MKTKNPVLKRVRFTFEVLCSLDDDPEELSISGALEECLNGEFSGLLVGSPDVKLLDLKQARVACAEHGDRFFGLPWFDIGAKVWWTDPDNNLCSGWWKVIGWIQGDTYHLTNAAGGECEALGHEL